MKKGASYRRSIERVMREVEKYLEEQGLDDIAIEIIVNGLSEQDYIRDLHDTLMYNGHIE